jgi:TolB protein
MTDRGQPPAITDGHRIADFVYEKLTGLPGYFATRIAYVIKSGPNFELQVADADGMNAATALRSREPIISPGVVARRQRLAYVSFEQKKPIVYVHTLATGQRRVVANFKGSNSAPSLVARRQPARGGADQGRPVAALRDQRRRLRRAPPRAVLGIDTEPFWGADGNIYFTSDRGGSPQIYRIPAGGGSAQRVSFEGNYNVSPRLSFDGKLLAFITRNAGRFQVAVQDLATRQTTILTDSARDESPSFAPNGRMILYATDTGGRGVLSAVSTDGRIRQRLTVQAADVREPAWGPQIR